MSVAPRSAAPLRFVAFAGLLLGLVALAVRLSTFFERGSWLVAYLLLVGFLAPLLLAREQRRSVPTGERERARALLWSIGVILVPAGVFADSRLLIAGGAAVLWSSLTVMLAASDSSRSIAAEPPSRVRKVHALLMAVMAASTAIGLGLAWDRPWI